MVKFYHSRQVDKGQADKLLDRQTMDKQPVCLSFATHLLIIRLLACLSSVLLSQPIFSQKMKTVEGEYTYHAPENVTLEEAKRTTLDRAKIQAIADAFGTIVSQNNATSVHNHNGK